MQEASKEEAIGTNVFKTNNLCVTAGAEEEGQPTETVKEKEKEKTLKSSQEMKEEEAHTVVSQENVQGEMQDQSFCRNRRQKRRIGP
jgi:hypothetical protein